MKIILNFLLLSGATLLLANCSILNCGCSSNADKLPDPHAPTSPQVIPQSTNT